MQSQSVPVPPTPPPPPTIVTSSQGGQVVTMVPGSDGTAWQVYQGAVAQKQELQNQLEQLEDRRRAIAQRLREGEVSGADRAGLESRLTELDAQITAKYKELSAAGERVVQTAGVPGATVDPNPRPRDDGPPEGVFPTAIMITLGLPLVIAYSRRIWRRAAGIAPSPAMTGEMHDRMTRIEDAVEAIAVEVERVGEGQRYLTRLLAPGSAAAEPIKLRDRVGVER